MKIVPLEAVGIVHFGEVTASIVAKLGEPHRRSISRNGRLEFHYPKMVCRFGSTGTLVEVTVDAADLELGSEPVRFAELGQHLKRRDPESFERVGFVVSPRLGVAFDPAYASFVTLFAAEEVPSWRAI
ncbi:MAG TPA: hypothetical protein VJM31_15065 [Vicinamibacterales bacterium]|nr:hypothetical protein [Vicinamibacterales bacterium]